MLLDIRTHALLYPLPKVFPETLIMLMLAIIVEILIGAILGFISQIFITAINVGALSWIHKLV